MQSIGVMIAAVIIWASPSLTIVDPICTFLFSILVLFTTLGVLRSALASALTSAPAHVSLPALTRDLLALQHVRAVYGLHVWEYGGVGDKGRVALEAHIVCSREASCAGVLASALAVAATHGATHPTLQVEPEGMGGGVVDAAGASLDVYEQGAQPGSSALLGDLLFDITGWRPFTKRAAARLYHLAPSRESLSVRALVEEGGCSGHGHSHGGGGAAAPPPPAGSFGGGHSHGHSELSLKF